jgi:hypothetical protein
MGWILFLEEDGRGKPTPHAWPDAQTRITIQGDGFRLSSGSAVSGQAVIDTDEIEHTNDFQQVIMWLRPEDEEEEPVEDGDEP